MAQLACICADLRTTSFPLILISLHILICFRMNQNVGPLFHLSFSCNELLLNSVRFSIRSIDRSAIVC